jgi:peptidoglycan L-alanyl-D-glutamate endopeptidase CwlK
MPTQLFHRIDLDRIYPRFLALILGVIAACERRGAVYFATYGIRSYAESNALYAQGRTTPGRIVSNARGGQSAHNFGIAIDFTHDSDANPSNGLQPDWNAEHYRILREELLRAGLVSGGDFSSGDWPHAQLAGFVTGAQLAPLDAIYRATPGDDVAKLRAVWAHLDALHEAAHAGIS